MRTTQLIGLLFVLALAAGGAQAQDRSADWLKRPTSGDIAALWPSAALKSGVGGRATVECIVTIQGTLRACKVVEERPENTGFGGAALALSRQFVMKPALKAGAPVESAVRIPIDFPKPDRTTGSYLRPVTDDPAAMRYKVYTGLPWREAPTYAQVMAAYPAKARSAKLGGTAVLECTVVKEGRLQGCRVLRELPDDKGFGNAARALAQHFVTPVTDSTGKSIIGARTHLPVTFAAVALDSPTPIIGRPQWLALPQMDDMTRVIPPEARQAQVYKARVVIECTVGPEGLLEKCASASEEPVGLGYDKAALALSKAFRLAVWTEDGLPTVGGSVRVPLRFDLEAEMKARAAKP